MSEQKEKEERDDLEEFWQSLEKEAARADRQFSYWTNLREDADKKLRESRSEEERRSLSWYRDHCATRAYMSANERVYVIYLKMIAARLGIQEGRIRRLERRKPHAVTKKDMEEMRTLNERNVQALRILDKLLAEQKQIQEREQPNVV
jgi:hypothetical protein